MTRALHRCGCGRTTTTTPAVSGCDRCWCDESIDPAMQRVELHRSRGQWAASKRSTP